MTFLVFFFLIFDLSYMSIVGSEGGRKRMTLLFTVALNMLTTPQNRPKMNKNGPKMV